jgi:hypothetical protein
VGGAGNKIPAMIFSELRASRSCHSPASDLLTWNHSVTCGPGLTTNCESPQLRWFVTFRKCEQLPSLRGKKDPCCIVGCVGNLLSPLLNHTGWWNSGEVKNSGKSGYVKSHALGQAWWLMPVILATWEIGGGSKPAQAKMLVAPYLKEQSGNGGICL